VTEIEQWIEDATASLGLNARRLSTSDARVVTSRARSKFVVGNPRVWWLSLRPPWQVLSSEDRNTSDVFPSCPAKILLVPETEIDEPPVYELSPVDIDGLLGSCPFFEYYVLAPDLSWIVVESDHNQFFVCESS